MPSCQISAQLVGASPRSGRKCSQPKVVVAARLGAYHFDKFFTRGACGHLILEKGRGGGSASCLSICDAEPLSTGHVHMRMLLNKGTRSKIPICIIWCSRCMICPDIALYVSLSIFSALVQNIRTVWRFTTDVSRTSGAFYHQGLRKIHQILFFKSHPRAAAADAVASM